MVVLGRECLRALRAHVTAKRPCPVLNEAGVVLGKQTFAAAEPTGYKSKYDSSALCHAISAGGRFPQGIV
jgi:hypothetical protein